MRILTYDEFDANLHRFGFASNESLDNVEITPEGMERVKLAYISKIHMNKYLHKTTIPFELEYLITLLANTRLEER